MNYSDHLRSLISRKDSFSDILQTCKTVLDPDLQEDFNVFVERFRGSLDKDDFDFLDLTDEDLEDSKYKFFERFIFDVRFVNSKSSKNVRDFMTLLSCSELSVRVPNLIQRSRERLSEVLHGVIPKGESNNIAAKYRTYNGCFFLDNALVCIASTELDNEDIYAHEYFHLISGIEVTKGTQNRPPQVQFSSNYYPNLDHARFYKQGLRNLNEALTEFLTLWLNEYHTVEDEEHLFVNKPKFKLADEEISYSEYNDSGYYQLVIALVKLASLFEIILRVKKVKTANLEDLLLEWYFADENSNEYSRLKERVDNVLGEGFFVNFINYFGSCFSLHVSKSTVRKKKLKLDRLIETLEACIRSCNVYELVTLVSKP